jgi:flagellar biosynthesis protein FlhF
MNMKRFFAQNSRDALRQVKGALGGDAVILSNRKVEGGVEVLAVANSDAQALVSEASRPAAVPGASPKPPNHPVRAAFAGDGAARLEPRLAAPDAAAIKAGLPGRSDATEGEIGRQVIREIQSMRGVIENQLSGLVWTDLQNRDPARAQLLRDLLASGFSPKLSRSLVERLPAGDAQELNKWAKSAIAKNLDAAAPDEIVGHGGVYALMGPTGVGKTTTTAKLAARCVVRHGAERLALLTTDSYRVGAYEHLKIYGRILGVSVHAARDEHELKATLRDLRGKHMVLIDTIGMSQRDKQVAEQVAMLSGAGPVRRLLVLNASCNADTLEDVVRVYGGVGLAGCVLSKVDEAASIGAALDTIVRHKLKLHFIANGQRVPEDLHPVNKQYLVDRALRRADSTVQAFSGAEVGVVMAGRRGTVAA